MLTTLSFRSTLISIACGISLSAHAMADTPRKVDVPAGEMTTALQRLAEQSGVEFVYSADQLKGVHTNGVHGEYTAEKAVTKLLEGTKLRLTVHQSGALLIAAPPAARPAATSQAGDGPVADPELAVPAKKSFLDRFRVAQAVVVKPAANTGAPNRDSAVEEYVPTVKGIPEVLVKGSKVSINADIERTEDDVQPYVVFTAEEIQRSMALNLEDFLKNRLPMNTVSVMHSQQTHNGSNISEINLRGLGVDETLVLVNGRRQAGVSNIADSGDTNFGQPDINGIPIASIERIEVLPATAAGIYGGGATGGVINIILKTNYTGLDVTADYANTFDTDSGVKRLSANGGMALEGGKTNIALSVSYSEQNEMLVRDRNFSQRARELQARNDPESFFGPYAWVPTGYTTNIRSAASDCPPPDFTCTLHNLVLKNGVDLGAPITHIPVGYSGDIQQLVANAGTYDLALANDISNAGRTIQNAPRTNSINLTVNRELTGHISMFANVARNENHGSVRWAGLQGSATIVAGAPNNPFTDDISVSFPLPGLSFEQHTDSEALNAVVGAAFNLPFRWRAQVEGSWGRSRTQTLGGQPFLDSDLTDQSSGAVVMAGVSSAIENGALDVLRDLNRTPLDLSPYALPYPNDFTSPTDSISRGGVLRLSGPVFRLPGGDVTLSGLLERRRNEAREVVQQGFIVFLGGPTYNYYPSRTSTTDSYYVETYVPVISPLNAKSWIRSLELQGSIRRDNNKNHSVLTSSIQLTDPNDRPDSVTYTDSSVAATGYNLGFRLAPIQDVALRASFSHGFLPPSISQIASLTKHTASSTSYFSDPLRLYELIGSQGDATVISNGNPNLKPEASDSTSMGLIVTPRFLEGLRLSVDYTRIRKTDEISAIDLDFMIQNPEFYPGRVVRGPALGDGLPGPITYLDMSLTNIDRTTVQAYDFQLDYAVRTDSVGSFDFYTLATMQKDYSRRLTVISPDLNSVGFRDGPLKWRGNAGIDWSRGALSLGWNMQFFDSYLVYKIVDGGDSIDHAVHAQGARKIPTQTYHDLSFRYRLGQGVLSGVGLFSGTVISGGVQNVLNTSPPLDVNFIDVGYSSYGDPRLRRYSLQLTKSF
ncbi:MAG: TonB-dependent receptor [Gammaproteobacteria bacterium]